MSLRCSLLGHEYGESEIERDREERGNEVVISVVELERCTRCGTTRTISENTEVTQLSGSASETTPGPPRSGTEPAANGDSGPGIEPRADAGAGAGGEPGIRARSTGDTHTKPNDQTQTRTRSDESARSRPADDSRDRSNDDARPWPNEDVRSRRTAPSSGVDGRRGSGAEAAAGARSESTNASGSDLGSGADANPADEDVEVMDGEGGGDREPGAWPDVGDHEEPSAGWPSVEGEDEGFDAEAPDGKTDLEFGGGLTPQADQGAEIMDAEGSEAGNGEQEPTFVSAGPTRAPDRPTDSDVEAALYCPNCGTRGLEARESLRAGDICPECHKGYLAEGER